MHIGMETHTHVRVCTHMLTYTTTAERHLDLGYCLLTYHREIRVFFQWKFSWEMTVILLFERDVPVHVDLCNKCIIKQNNKTYHILKLGYSCNMTKRNVLDKTHVTRSTIC